MKTILFAIAWGLACSSALAEDWFRALPDPNFCAKLTQQVFPNVDGVIIIKEQSLNVHRAEGTYRGLDLVGLGMTRTTIVIAKVFNEAGVKRLGSFEFEYREHYGDQIPSRFMARARVQKPDGSVIVMPEDDLSIVVSHQDRHGDPLARKALFKVPNLMPGDVVQLEYVLTEPFVRAYSGIFYYQDRMPTLFSNLAITCQERDEVRVFSFPAERIGEPKISQIATTLGSGETRFWSVKNLNAIPDEPCGHPFEEMSMMTAFIADEQYHDRTDWGTLSKNFWKEYLDKGSVKDARVRELGFLPSKDTVRLERVDSLYTALRKAIVLNPVNEVYPLVDYLDEVFEKKSGDASDLAAIFYKILQDWNVNVRAVWLRDRRQGTFESVVPTLRWFDRIGALVRIGDVEKLYDFDRAIPSHFSTPWFLKGITAMVFDGKSCIAKNLPAAKPGEAWIRESHDLAFGEKLEVRDSMSTTGAGAPVEDWRDGAYELKGAELNSYLQKAASANCVEAAADVQHSPLFDEREITVGVKGKSKATVALIDSFVSLRPSNEVLKALQDELLTPGRTNEVVLEEPYTMTIEWTIHHPSGYVLAELPKDTSITGFRGGAGSLLCQKMGDDAHMTARLDLKTQIIPVADFNSMMRLLVGLERSSERAVTFRKK
jgi:hypothetical protein